MIHQLKSFSKLSISSPYILNNGVELLIGAFSGPKPLFGSLEDKELGRRLLTESLNNLKSSLTKFAGSLNVDKRQTALKVRSGLEYLIEELRVSESEKVRQNSVISAMAVGMSVDEASPTGLRARDSLLAGP